METQSPLIVTLRFDAASFALFDGMRRRHFPAARNHIPAHLTLFHSLPSEAAAEISAKLASRAGATRRFALAVTGVRFLGYGSAYHIESGPLLRLRADLATDWASWLTRQDAQHFQPHVTIQNKASAHEAKALFAILRDDFEPFEAEATGLLLWRYLNGPWRAEGTFDLQDGP